MITYTSSENIEDATLKVVNDLALKEVLKLKGIVAEHEKRLLALENEYDDGL